jgi:hypothetical protein
MAKGVVKVMAYTKAKTAAVGALAFLLVGGGAASVGYYVLHGDDPSAAVVTGPPAPGGAGATTAPTPFMWSDAPASRPVYNGPLIVGYVQTADGKPVVGANVKYAYGNFYTQISSTATSNVGLGAPSARTQADGRFQFMPTQADPRSIAVQSADGYGMATVSSLASTPIRLIPWSRIEGTAKIGSKPAANAQVRYNMSGASAPNSTERILVMITGNTQADAQGRFVLEKVPAGSVYVDVTLPGERNTAARSLVEVHGGSTATVMIGGTGRPVIGRVTPIPQATSGRATLGTQPPQLPRMPAASTTNPAERQKILAAFNASPAYQDWLKRRQFPSQDVVIDADGRFRIEDVPAGTYQLNVSYYDLDRGSTSSNYVENAGHAMVPVTIPQMEGGRSDQPLNVGDVHLIIPRRVVAGQPAPEVTGLSDDGKNVKLSDYRGKYVLMFISRYPSANESVWQDAAKARVIRDRYRGDPRLEMIMFCGKQSSLPPATLARQSGIDLPIFILRDAIPEDYISAGEMIFLIDPQGKLVAKNLNAPTAFMRVDEVLSATTAASASLGSDGAQVAIGHLQPGTPEGARFANVPSVSDHDAATNGTFSVVDGRGTEPSNSVDRLRDGREASGDDAPSQNFFFETGTLEGRLKLDLGKTISVGQVNSYSRHKNWRAPQVYVLYGSDGAASGFDGSPKIGTDPAAVGWKKIAAVDARLKDGVMGGRYGVSVSHPSGSLGRFRYLLFEMFPSETRDPFGQAFYGEIDVVEGR